MLKLDGVLMNEILTVTIKTDLGELAALLGGWFETDALWGLVAHCGERAAWGDGVAWLQAEQWDHAAVTVKGDAGLVGRIAAYYFPAELNAARVAYFDELRRVYLPPFSPDEAEYVRETSSFAARAVADFWPLSLHDQNEPGFRVSGENIGRFVDTLRSDFRRREAGGQAFYVLHPQFMLVLWAEHTWIIEPGKITINPASAFCVDGIDEAMVIEIRQVAGDVQGFIKPSYPFIYPAVEELLAIIQDMWPSAQVNGIAPWPGMETAVSSLLGAIDEVEGTAVDEDIRRAQIAKQYGIQAKTVPVWEEIARLLQVPLTQGKIAERLDIPERTIRGHIKKMRDTGFLPK